jgi:hypothetical protein
MSPDLTKLPVHALAGKIKSRSVSPVDLVATCLDRIAKLDPKLHAFVEVYESEARLAAEAADKAIRSGHAVGPLHGIPIALKDLIELEGRIASGGSAAWRNRRCTRTATLVQKLISAGFALLLVMYQHGLRVSEATGMRLKALDPGVVQRLKGSLSTDRAGARANSYLRHLRHLRHLRLHPRRSPCHGLPRSS